MKNGLLLTLLTLLGAAGPGLAQTPAPPTVVPPPGGDTGTSLGWLAEKYADEDRLYFSTEYLMWWVKGLSVPVPLAPLPFPPFTPSSGTVGDEQTGLALAPGVVNTGMSSGARLTAGWWGDADHTF